MEILVILMFAVIFFAIAMFIVSFIMLRKRHNEKVYAKGGNDYYLDDDEEDELSNNIDSDIDAPNDIINQSDDEAYNKLNNDKLTDDKEEKDEVLKNEEPLLEEIVSDDYIKQETVIDEKEIDVIIPSNNKLVTPENKINIEEVINVLINKKNYIFLANGNVVNKGDHVKVLLNKKIYYGLITKANYSRDISAMKVKPKKLFIIKDNKNNKKEEIEVLDTELDFVPKKKQK